MLLYCYRFAITNADIDAIDLHVILRIDQNILHATND